MVVSPKSGQAALYDEAAAAKPIQRAFTKLQDDAPSPLDNDINEVTFNKYEILIGEITRIL